MENSSTKNKHDGMPVADVESEDKLPVLSLSQLKELHFVSEGLFYFVYRHKGQDQVVLFFAESFEDAKHRMAEMKMHSRLGGIVTGMEQDAARFCTPSSSTTHTRQAPGACSRST